MQLYKATVRLDGNVLHEVPKTDLTAAEIILLRHTHGEDGVVAIKKCNPGGKKVNTNNSKQESERLKMKYGERIFVEVFGSGYIDTLPKKLNDISDPELDDTPSDEDLLREAGQDDDADQQELKRMQRELLQD